MDLILDELQRNNVEIDMSTVLHHINYLIERHEWAYGNMVRQANRENISEFFFR